MKFFLQSTLFLAATALTGVAAAAAAQPQSGSNCNISAEVDCRLTDGTNRVCKALENKPFSQCSKNLRVKWTYRYCNLNAQAIYFHKHLFQPLLHNVDVTFATDITGLKRGFDRTEMYAGECRAITISKVLNTCEKRNTVASLKLEGNLSNKPNGGGNYCYAWAFSMQRIGGPPQASFKPNPPATQALVHNKHEPADISMSLTCKYESRKGSGIFNRDCSDIQTIVPNTPHDCSIPVEYYYAVVNRSTSERAKVQGIVDEETNNIATQYEVLNPFERYMEVVKGSIDICARKGVPVEKKAVALAASLPSGIPGSANASLTIPMPAIISQWELINIGCVYNGMPCSSSMCCIQGEVDFTYNVHNKGYVCNDIQKATVNFGGATTRVLAMARVLAMDDSHPCSTDREFCPGDTWAFKEKRYVDTCSNTPFDYQIVIGLYTTHGTATSIGSWNSPSAIQPSPTPPVPVPVPVPVPAPTPTHPTTPNLPVCTTEAMQLIFMYHGGHSCRHGRPTHHRKRNLRSPSGKYKSSKEVQSSKESKPSSSSSSSSWFSSSSSSSSSSSHSSSTTITSTTSSSSGGGSSSSSSSSMTIISSATTSFCDCNDFAMTSTSDAVKIEVTSKNEKKFYGHHDNHSSGSTFIVTSGDDGSTLTSNIAVKIYNMHGAIVQTILVHTGGQCLEDIIDQPMGSLTLIGWV